MPDDAMTAIAKWEADGKITGSDADVARTFARYLQLMPPPGTATLLDVLRLPADVRDFAFPGYGPLDRPCDYSMGMGV